MSIATASGPARRARQKKYRTIREAIARFEAARASGAERYETEPAWGMLGRALARQNFVAVIHNGTFYSGDILLGSMRDWDNEYGASVFSAGYVLDLDALDAEGGAR